jgi:hypothetical protein
VSDGEIFNSSVLKLRAFQISVKLLADFGLFDGLVISSIVLGVSKAVC